LNKVKAKLERPPKRFGEGGLPRNAATAGKPFTFVADCVEATLASGSMHYVLKSGSGKSFAKRHLL
jgi:hypothetical protein